VKPRRRLFWKYVVVFVSLVSGALLASGLIEIYFSYQENKAALIALQQEKAMAAASRIESYIKEIERQIGWTTQPSLAAPAAVLEQRRFDYLRLLRQVQAITEVSYLDPKGREQLQISRLKMDVAGSGIDYSAEPKFKQARAQKTWYGPVTFRKESEPYMVIAMAGSGQQPSVTVADVNLKFIWDVISQIKVGRAGHAYVVDGAGVLIAHPDISLVLQKTLLASLPQVAAAITAGPSASADEVAIARDAQGRSVLSAHAPITPLRWSVFVEQPLEEAFAPLRGSVQRTIFLVLLFVSLSVLAGLVLARRMVTPIRALQAGAARIGAGDLADRIAVRTGDELETLADQFNSMAGQLQESYANLEQKVETRTRELTETLEQQTATSEILRMISSSPTDVRPTFDAIARSATRLCDAVNALVLRFDGTMMHLAAHYNLNPERLEVLERIFPMAPTRGSVSGRVILTRTTVQVVDVSQDPEYTLPHATTAGYRSVLAVPMLREGAPIGAILVARDQVSPFSSAHLELLQTFADQAVIAVENVRLFKELETRTHELTRSVDQLTALEEVGRAVSSTLDLETVLTTIVSRAVQLSGADAGAAYEYNEAAEGFELRVTQGYPQEFLDVARPLLLRKGEGATGQLAVTRQPVQIPDIAVPGAYQSRLGDILIRLGQRALLAVPLLREDRVIGGLIVNRKMPGDFPPEVVDLLKTFATQSALAIQNARLFRELEEKSRELEIASQHKSEFLANMSHELRTPLNAIIGFSEVLGERMFGDLNEKQAEYAEDILGSGRHLLSLINDILDLSKIEAGRMELDITRFDLPLAIDNALTLVRERAARHGVSLAVDVDPRLGEIGGDERKLKQVLLNLLSNAVKFTPEGGRVGVQATLANGNVEIAVTDTGIGIAPTDQEAIFEEFRQVGGDYLRKREGTGLGLTLAKRFIELHGGRIWVKSAVGQGSTFTISLPLTPPVVVSTG
jgi:signal transduction histidine kinase